MRERPRTRWRAGCRFRLLGAGAAAGVAMLSADPLMAAQETGGGGLLSINPGLMIWTWVIFLLLLGILAKWAWGPILGALEARERRIQQTLDEAAREREEAERLLAEHRRLMDEARGQVKEILAEGRKASERLRAELLAETRAQKEQMLERTRAEILRERAEALEALRREAVDLSISAAERVLQRSVDTEENRRVVEEYLERLAAESGGDGAG